MTDRDLIKCEMCGRGPLLEHWHQNFPVDRILCTYDAKKDQRDTYPCRWQGTFHPASGAVEIVSLGGVRK
jgi:hypothetical protein